MKALFFFFLAIQSSIIIAQPLTGIWHGKIYDNNSEAIKYINISISGEGKNLKATLRHFDKPTNKWIPTVTHISTFSNAGLSGILATINKNRRGYKSDAYLLSHVNSKRMAVEWVSQLNQDSIGLVMTKHGSGFLEPFLGGRIYESLSIGGSSTNRVSIDRVEIAKDVTVITFSYHNTSLDEVMMRLTKPGEIGAYYITPTDRSKKYYLVDKDNIAFEPDNTLVRPNSYHTFKIYFEPLPDSLKSFSILEGEPELQSGKEWNFYDIQLK